MKIFLTTTLPYINSTPHIGHFLEMVQADMICRYLKEKYGDVIFSTGVDEHGLKVYNTSVERGISTQEYCDNYANIWQNFLNVFYISPDIFWRTTSDAHKKGVYQAWDTCFRKGDIYEKEYNGLYCIGCESFKTDKDLVEGKCPDHPHLIPKETNERNYFFRLSKYKDYLLNWIEENPDFLTPNSKIEELKNLIIDSDDISITRLKTSVPWGIPVPNDSEQNIYVWFEALCNYIISANWDKERWCNSVQICGPDNLRFQGVIWQAILKSLDVPQTKKLLVHGTVLDQNGLKMSKSIGNVIDPVSQLKKYGLSAVRFYALGSLPTYSNCSWSETDLVAFYNAHLVNNFGNLINRVITLLQKNISIDELDHIIKNPNYDDLLQAGFDEMDFQGIIYNRIGSIENHLSNFQLRDAIENLNEYCRYLNQYITLMHPWNRSRGECVALVAKIYEALSKVLKYYKMILPEKEDVLNRVFYDFDKEIIFPKI
jgi:methionyl-tRNA synthetase